MPGRRMAGGFWLAASGRCGGIEGGARTHSIAALVRSSTTLFRVGLYSCMTIVSLQPLLSNVPAEHQFLLASGLRDSVGVPRLVHGLVPLRYERSTLFYAG